MSLHPMISALRKHKAGVILIVLQIALTLAIVCNSMFIISTRVERIDRPTGVDEADLFLITQQWEGVGASDKSDTTEKLDAMQREDLATLRSLPQIASAAPINSLPLLDSGAWNGGVSLKPDQPKASVQASFYFSDETALATLGLKLIAGRAFIPSDIQHKAFGSPIASSTIIISQKTANLLFPGGNALGKTLYLDGGSTPALVVGITARLQTPSASAFSDMSTYSSILVPSRLDSTFSRYVIRAKPGQLSEAEHVASAALYKTNPQRVIAKDGIQSYAEIRRQAYRGDIGMAALMGGVSLILVCITAAGIFGLTSFWVDQRRRQIGIRRALGARRRDIISYFQFENLMIVATGAVTGVALAITLNLLLISRYEMNRLPVKYVVLGALLILVLSQFSTFVPARRAAKVEPASAIRAV